MKKFYATTAAVAVLALAFAGCSSSEEGSNAPVVINEETSASAEASEEAGSDEGDSDEDSAVVGGDMFTFVYEGTSIPMNTPIEPVFDILGEDYVETSAPSCAYQGMDYTYTYDHLIVRSYTNDVEDETSMVCGIEFRDDTVFTNEGISIGASRDDVIATYGEADTDSEGGLIYDNGEISLTFFLEDGVVVGISYTLDQE